MALVCYRASREGAVAFHRPEERAAKAPSPEPDRDKPDKLPDRTAFEVMNKPTSDCDAIWGNAKARWPRPTCRWCCPAPVGVAHRGWSRLIPRHLAMIM